MTVAWAALLVSIGQLLVGVLALRSPKSEVAPPASVTGLAANQRSLNAMLLAAVALFVAATALLKVEASNDAAVAFFNSLESSSSGVSTPAPTDVLTQVVQRGLVVLGVSSAGFCIFLAQRAWRGWSGSSPNALGVALSALLAMAAGTVGVSLFAAMEAPV